MRRLLPALLFLLGCSTPKLAEVTAPTAGSGEVLFTNVAVFDGETLAAARDVLVTGGEIAAVGDAGSLTPPAGVERVDGTGRTLLPGLVDSHAHLFSAGEKSGRPPDARSLAQAFLYAGVTTLLVTGGGDEVSELQAAVAKGEALAPGLYFAGPGVTAPGGHPVPLLKAMLPWPVNHLAAGGVFTAADPEEARKRVAEIEKKYRPGFLKIIFDDLPPGSPHLSKEALEAAVEEAKKRGLRPIVHATTTDDAVTAAEAGAELLVHVPQRGVLDDGQVARLKATGVTFVSTIRLITASHEIEEHGASDLERAIVGEDLVAPWRKSGSWDLAGFSEEIDQLWSEVAADTRKNFQTLVAAGIPVLAGTDSGVHGVFPGASLHRELQTFVELGVSPADALRRATSAPADFLDPEAGFGRIAPGRRADLLLVRGDPTEDIDALSDIEAVYLGGRRLSRGG